MRSHLYIYVYAKVVGHVDIIIIRKRDGGLRAEWVAVEECLIR